MRDFLNINMATSVNKSQFLFMSILFLAIVSSATGKIVVHQSTLTLSDLPVWKRHAGYWISNQTFLSSNGKPYTIDSWPYSYGVYKGFIKIEIDGSNVKERGIYLYTPLSRRECYIRKCAGKPTVLGNGKCSHNSNEKVFKGEFKATDEIGNLAGTFNSGALNANVSTTVIGDDSVLYRFTIADNLFQNLLTTVVGNTKVRTGQFYSGNKSVAASYYRERKVSEAEWHRALRQARRKYRVQREDYCGYFVNDVRTGISCAEWFA